jgi:hypothetical protein
MELLSQLRQLPLHCLGITLGLLLALPVSAQPQVVACDLMDAQTASEVLREDIQQHAPNREVKVADSVAVSNCVYMATKGNVRVLLSEYGSPADATRAVQAITYRPGAAKFTAEKALGEQAFWWSVGQGSYGYVIRKDKRVLYVDTRWYETLDAAEARQRLERVIGPMTTKF